MRRGTAWIAGTVAVAAVVALLLAARARAPVPESATSEAGSTAGAPPTLAARPERARESAAHEPPAEEDDTAPTTPPKRNPAGVALRVDLVDALTGEPVEGSWISEDAVRAALDISRRVLLRLEATIRELRARAGEPVSEPPQPKAEPEPAVDPRASAYRASGETQRVAPGTEGRRVLLVRLPAGRRLWDTEEPFVYDVAADVRQARYVLPVFRSIPLRIVAVGPDGRRAEGVTVAAVSVGGRRVPELSPSEVAGDPVVSLPFLPGEEVRVGLDWMPDPEASFAQELSETEVMSPEWAGTVPSNPWDEWRAEVRLKGPCGHLSDHNETDNDLPTEESVSPAPASPKPIRIRATDLDGTPIAYADVHCGPFVRKTGLDGFAVFEAIPIGTYRFTIGAAGRLSGSREVVVPSEGTDSVEIREPKGAVLEVTVVDADGRPRPFAEVRPGAAAFEVQDGVQRLDPYTDARGVRTFARVQPGKTVVRASWAGHFGRADVDLADGERTSVRVVVP